MLSSYSTLKRIPKSGAFNLFFLLCLVSVTQLANTNFAMGNSQSNYKVDVAGPSSHGAWDAEKGMDVELKRRPSQIPLVSSEAELATLTPRYGDYEKDTNATN